LAWPLALMDYLSLLVAIGWLGNCSRALGRWSQTSKGDGKRAAKMVKEISIDSCVGKILAKGNRI